MEVSQLFDMCFRYVYDKVYNATEDVMRAELITKKVFLLLAEYNVEHMSREEWLTTADSIASHEIRKYKKKSVPNN